MLSTVSSRRIGFAQLFFTVVLSVLLSACGWQLRGATLAPNIESLALVGASTKLKYAVEDTLAEHDILVFQEARHQLEVRDEEWMRRTSAVDAQGRQAEIELRFTLYWHVRDRKTGALLTTPRRLMVLRTLPWYPENATASSDEEQLVRDDLYEDMSQRLINQIATASQRWEQP